MGSLFVPNLIDLGLSVSILWLSVAALRLIERVASRFVSHRLGWNGVLVTGWLGVPLHELSHLLVARLFGHRIVAWKLFDPDPSTGTLGYVWHAYRRRNLWQVSGGFFIGIAPLVAGASALLLLTSWMVPDGSTPSLVALRLPAGGPVASAWLGAANWGALPERLASSMLVITSAVWRSRTAWLPVQVYACIAVASHLAPSGRDVGSAICAMPVVLGGLVGSALVASLAGVSLATAAVLAPAAALLVVMVSCFQGLYAAAIGAAGAASSRARRVMGRA